MDVAVLSVIVTTVIILAFLTIGVNVGVTLGLAGMAGIIIFTGKLSTGLALPMLLGVSVTTTYGFVVIPLFVLLASLASESEITTGLFNAAYKWMGKLPGGTAIATIITCAGMATLTGSSAATAATMARVALPELKKFNYDEALSVGTVTVGGTLAIMIPPSVTFVLYSIFAEQSIGKLLIAGILPGLILAGLFILMLYIRVRLNPSLAPASPSFTLREKLQSLRGVIPFVILVAAIVLGILFGIWTPVEAAAVGVVAIFLMGLIRKELTFASFAKALADSVVTSTSIMLVVIGSMIFSTYLALTGFSEGLTSAIVNSGLSPHVLFIIMILFYLVLGMFLEATSILALTVPLMMPIIEVMGWSPVWFGVILVLMMEVAAISPPVGLNLYAVKAVLPETPIKTIIMGSLPFIVCCFAAVAILYLFPGIPLILPNMM